MNSYSVVGACKFVEIKKTPTGKTVVRFQVSTQDGTKEKPQWTRHRITAWENPVAETLVDGDHVIVHGSFKVDEYEDKTGQKKQAHYLLARYVGKTRDGKSVSTAKSAGYGEAPAQFGGSDEDIPF